MSVFTHEQVSIMAAERLGLNEAAALDLQPLVPSALNALGVEIAGNPKERHWLLTDPATTSVTLTSGSADVSGLITSDNILIDFLRYGNVYYNVTTGQPLSWINQVGVGRMAGPYDQFFNHVFQQGATLFVRGPNSTALSGTLYLAVNYVPTLADLPEAMVDDLVSTIARLRTSTGKADTTVAT